MKVVERIIILKYLHIKRYFEITLLYPPRIFSFKNISSKQQKLFKTALNINVNITGKNCTATAISTGIIARGGKTHLDWRNKFKKAVAGWPTIGLCAIYFVFEFKLTLWTLHLSWSSSTEAIHERGHERGRWNCWIGTGERWYGMWWWCKN